MNTTINFGALIVEHEKFTNAKQQRYGNKVEARAEIEESRNLIERLDKKDMDIIVAPNIEKGKYKGPIAYLRSKLTQSSKVISGNKKVRYRGKPSCTPGKLIDEIWKKAKDVKIV